VRHLLLLCLGALLTVGSGCGPDAADAAVLEAPDTVVWLDTESYGLDPGSPTQLLLLYDSSVHGCVELKDLQATQNGRALRQLSAGGEVDPGFMRPGGCATPVFEAFMPDASEELTSFVLSAGGQTLVAEFQYTTAPLSMRLREPADGLLRPGTRAVLEYFPATDVLLAPTLHLEGPAGSRPWAPNPELMRLEPGTLTFTVPLELSPGATQLSLMAFTYSGTLRCTAGRCRNRRLKEATLAVTLVAAASAAGEGAP
jgi:hypothetical protein